GHARHRGVFRRSEAAKADASLRRFECRTGSRKSRATAPICESVSICQPGGNRVTRRRTILGGAASLGLLVAARHAIGQRPITPFRIGYLSLRAGPNAWDEAFVQRLRELGYRNGDNLVIEYRWADDDLSLLERQGGEFVGFPPAALLPA